MMMREGGESTPRSSEGKEIRERRRRKQGSGVTETDHWSNKVGLEQSFPGKRERRGWVGERSWEWRGMT